MGLFMTLESINLVAQAYDKTDASKATSEKLMNILGWLPIISIFSGLIRAIDGAVDAGKYTDRMEFEAEKALGVGLYTEEERQIAALNVYKNHEYREHSFKNQIRGVVEILGSGTVTFGCILYDLFGGRQRYTGENGSNLDLVSVASNPEVIKNLLSKDQLVRIEAARFNAFNQKAA
jgi:hypothetical protein